MAAAKWSGWPGVSMRVTEVGRAGPSGEAAEEQDGGRGRRASLRSMVVDLSRSCRERSMI